MISAEHSELQRKLGIDEDTYIHTNLAPEAYQTIVGVPEGRIITTPNSKVEFAHLFVTHLDELIGNIESLLPHLSKTGSLWISWKKGMKDKGLNRDKIRDFVLETDLVDCKVCSVNAEWSALKFMFRLSRR